MWTRCINMLSGLTYDTVPIRELRSAVSIKLALIGVKSMVRILHTVNCR